MKGEKNLLLFVPGGIVRNDRLGPGDKRITTAPGTDGSEVPTRTAAAQEEPTVTDV